MRRSGLVIAILSLTLLESIAWIIQFHSPTWLWSSTSARRSRERRGCHSFWTRPSLPSSSSLSTTLAPNTESTRQVDQKYNLRLLLIDHYDSFTYNLVDIFTQLCTKPPVVLAADYADSWGDLMGKYYPPELGTNQTGNYYFDAVILSPGPGNPQTSGNLSRDIILRNPNLPILGVCLGHQIMGYAYGATVDLAPCPVHGQVHSIRIVQPDDPLWKGLDTTMNVTRYHSLHVTSIESATATGLVVSAVVDHENSTDVVMAMRHCTNPHFGVQFHPESVGTPRGKDLLANFCSIAQQYRCQHERSDKVVWNMTAVPDKVVQTTNPKSICSLPEILVHKVPNDAGYRIQPEQLIDELKLMSEYCYWLDGDVHLNANSPFYTAMSKISILGYGNHRIEYWGKDKPRSKQGVYEWIGGDESSFRHCPSADVLTYLQREYETSTTNATLVSWENYKEPPQMLTVGEDQLRQSLPFDFRGGHVGFLGYEVRHDTARFLEEKEGGNRQLSVDEAACYSNPNIPTAAFIRADKSYVYDQQTKDWYLVGVVHNTSVAEREEVLEWMKETSEQLRVLVPSPAVERKMEVNVNNNGSPLPLAVSLTTKPTYGTEILNGRKVNGCAPSRMTSQGTSTQQVNDCGAVDADSRTVFRPNQSRHEYNENFDMCIENIRQGNSYELCLTNQFETNIHLPGSCPLKLYKILRRNNPSPFSAFFHWNASRKERTPTDAAFSLCCSSPERFVSVKPLTEQKCHDRTDDPHRGGRIVLQVEAKPIKGTTARVIPVKGQTLSPLERDEDDTRARALQSSIKNRAENLMIVDLLRNDLSRVCQPGSVHVAKLMDIESFATVHQMVSTIRGILDPTQATSVDLLRACFPGGSMTGAPKLRTMDILDELERGVCRGPYSGSLGYFSRNGCMDMNIIIRTAVLTPMMVDDGTAESDGWKVSVGAGGAITALSENDDEYDEMKLKASVVLKAVAEWANTGASVKGSSLIMEDNQNLIQ